ncbi:PREDICTED: centromere protein P isoform X2 [Cyprinodon variegatus]|uniref:centromere protein P isoform X2 n=1 Tax=Cyprinodon variegatus TaxID=28743 RepID=UPI000742BED7|nr:PREDICTED: centromere protein P isoform X2 [Cyprinodon variegatus]
MSEENSAEVKLLEAQIQDMQAEIKALQQQHEDNCKEITFQYRGQMQNTLAVLSGRALDQEETVVSKLKEEVEELEDSLKLQTEINGISLNSCTIKTLQNRKDADLPSGILGPETVQQICLSCRSSELSFQVEFLLSEVKNESSSEQKITDLNLVLDSDDLPDLSSFLSRVEGTRDLPLLFRTIRTFLDRSDDRTRTFQHFQLCSCSPPGLQEALLLRPFRAC